jgi:hypothetical protein
MFSATIPLQQAVPVPCAGLAEASKCIMHLRKKTMKTTAETKKLSDGAQRCAVCCVMLSTTGCRSNYASGKSQPGTHHAQCASISHTKPMLMQV